MTSLNDPLLQLLRPAIEAQLRADAEKALREFGEVKSLFDHLSRRHWPRDHAMLSIGICRALQSVRGGDLYRHTGELIAAPSFADFAAAIALDQSNVVEFSPQRRAP